MTAQQQPEHCDHECVCPDYQAAHSDDDYDNPEPCTIPCMQHSHPAPAPQAPEQFIKDFEESQHCHDVAMFEACQGCCKRKEITRAATLTENKRVLDEQNNIINYIRYPVLKFAVAMETVLRKNDYKGGWENCTYDYLFRKLQEERHEVNEEYDDPQYGNIEYELLDEGAVCMMMFDLRSCSIIPKEIYNLMVRKRDVWESLRREQGGGQL